MPIDLKRWMKQFRQNNWKQDVETYWRWKHFHEIATSEFSKNAAKKRMEEIQKKWPNNPME